MAAMRLPALAGVFYPDQPDALRQMVDGYLESVPPHQTAPKAIIAPHAGYIYSGAVAATAYARLMSAQPPISRVIVLGPSHHIAFRGVAATSATQFATPLGHVPVALDAVNTILTLPQVNIIDQAHALEHSVEVQLPFLQRVLKAFELVPLVVGDACDEEVSEVLNRLWGGPETLIVISSDLSHYHDYISARQLDGATSKAIEALDPNPIQFKHACGRNPMAGLLLAAKAHDLRATTIDLRNSGDTIGSKDRVVGYGAYAFE